MDFSFYDSHFYRITWNDLYHMADTWINLSFRITYDSHFYRMMAMQKSL